jgi:peptide-methionine (S)-S-oxide reductase
MEAAIEQDSLFHEAVKAVDAGDVRALEELLAAHPELARDRLESPGKWLRDKVGRDLEPRGFFERPYLLWFVAEDPVRNDALPPNIADAARAIIAAARRENAATLQEQLDYALSLVSWSWVAPRCGVQIELIDVLLDAGASPHGNPENALVNGHFEAARHLVERGAKLTLGTAMCLELWDDAARLAPTATASEKQFALTLAALRGKVAAIARLIEMGADVNAPSDVLYSHGMPLHHAVCSASLDAVKVLVAAGANLAARDSVHHATPLGWAEYYLSQHARDQRTARYNDIAVYLRSRGAAT